MSVQEALETILRARQTMKALNEDFVSPLDRRNGRVPSWSEIATEFELHKLPRGQRKLFQTYYRAQRMFALGKKIKGRRLIEALDHLPHFKKFEDENAGLLTSIAKKVRPKDR